MRAPLARTVLLEHELRDALAAIDRALRLAGRELDALWLELQHIERRSSGSSR